MESSRSAQHESEFRTVRAQASFESRTESPLDVAVILHALPSLLQSFVTFFGGKIVEGCEMHSQVFSPVPYEKSQGFLGTPEAAILVAKDTDSRGGF
ncbi:hypothetical protein CDAR_586451 [Caerostris darwini]|uniref:Uncharacterized protein n=1 Tax=Caerostris darwini TaxID=1538125 RepID=A0AAV4Q9D1_9ARAC|nr:hypothetical protein CDAR_586451 [Caerostris darwini]